MRKYNHEEGSGDKIEIYTDYLKSAVPVFLKSPFFQAVEVYDLFAGDSSEYGSAKNAYDILANIKNPKNKPIYFILNDSKSEYANSLQKNIVSTGTVTVMVHNEVFETLLPKLKLSTYGTGRIVFLDQHGIKAVNKNNFETFISKGTDILFFISSTNIYRFKEEPSFQNYLDTRNINFDDKDYRQCHRQVFEYFKSLIPVDRKFHMGSFSILKKDSSHVNGLIFGSTHTLGMEKFLQACWKKAPKAGDANYNIDGDIGYSTSAQGNLFSQTKPLKIEQFECLLESKILNKSLKTNAEVYLFTIESGMLYEHSNAVIRNLIGAGKIEDLETIDRRLHKLKPQEIILLK